MTAHKSSSDDQRIAFLDLIKAAPISRRRASELFDRSERRIQQWCAELEAMGAPIGLRVGGGRWLISAPLCHVFAVGGPAGRRELYELLALGQPAGPSTEAAFRHYRASAALDHFQKARNSRNSDIPVSRLRDTV